MNFIAPHPFGRILTDTGKMKNRIALYTCLMASAAWCQPTPDSCANLAKLNLPDTTITVAQMVAAGEFTQPANPNAGPGRGAAPVGRGGAQGASGAQGPAAGRGGGGGGRGPSPI